MFIQYYYVKNVKFGVGENITLRTASTKIHGKNGHRALLQNGLRRLYYLARLWKVSFRLKSTAMALR